MSERLNKHRLDALRKLSVTLSVQFTNINLLHQALTHTSYANECKNSTIKHIFTHASKTETLFIRTWRICHLYITCTCIALFLKRQTY